MGRAAYKISQIGIAVVVFQFSNQSLVLPTDPYTPIGWRRGSLDGVTMGGTRHSGGQGMPGI
jgi:hypothetical protein